jgi:hypothetical protein
VCLCTINTDNSAKTKTGNVHITQHWSAFMKPLLPWKSSMYYTFVCMCTSASVCFCVLTLLIQHATCTHHIVCGNSGSTFFNIYHKQHNFWKNVTENKMWVLIFSTTFI